MLKLFQGNPIVEYYIKTASTPMLNGNVVQLSSGQVIAATATSLKHIGVIMRDTISTDADYATSNISVPVLVPDDETVFLADVKPGTAAFTASLVGVQCQLYIGQSGQTTGEVQYECYVDPNSTAHAQVTIVKVISQTQVLVKINSSLFTQNAA